MDEAIKDYATDNIFTDKIKISKDLVSSEGQIMTQYNEIIRRLITGEIEESELYRDPEYFRLWKNLLVLFDFLEYKYAPKLQEIKEEEYDRLVELIKVYRNRDKTMNLHELSFVYNNVRKIMQISGFHDVTTASKGKTDFMKPRNTWDASLIK